MKKLCRVIVNLYIKANKYCVENPLVFWLVSPAVLISPFIIFKNLRKEFLRIFYEVSMITVPVSIVCLVGVITVLIALLIICINKSKKLNSHQREIYSNIINIAKDLLEFDNWENWTYSAQSPTQQWNARIFDNVEEFRVRVFSYIWPRTLPELERALKTLALVMWDARETFSEHADFQGEIWRGIRYYKLHHVEQEEFHRLVEEYEEWTRKCDLLFLEGTKAANWVADVVRRDLDPSFFATKGRFIILSGPYDDLSTRRSTPEYTQKERKGMPYKALKG